MIKNYLTIFWRNIYRQPIHTFLNLACLAIGISACLVIMLYVNFELNYDRSHTKADRIYHVNTKAVKTGDVIRDVNWEGTPGILGPYIQKDYPEVESYTRLYRFFRDDNVKFSYGENFIEDENVFVVDSAALNIFSFDFIYGDAHEALHGPNKIIISESLSKKIFQKENPVGEILKTNLAHIFPETKGKYELIISGVYRDLPRNSHFIANALISSRTDPHVDNYYFKRFIFGTYVLLNDGVIAADFAPKLTDIYTNYLDAKIEPVLKSANHNLVPLTKIHLLQTGGMNYIYIFSAIGFLILLISMISYVNLVTAQASKRALEIGIRKVMGSNRRQLIFQFLAESLFFAVLSLCLAIVLVMSFVKPLNGALGLHLNIEQLWQPQILLGMLIVIGLLGVLGGSYPAFFLSSFQPIKVLKGKLAKGAPLRRLLVGVQFAVVIFVLCCTGMIYDQLQFLRQQDLGFDQEQILQLELSGGNDWYSKWETLKNELEKSPYISSAGTASFTPGRYMGTRPVSADEGTLKGNTEMVRWGAIDADFFKTVDVTFIAGRGFSKEFTTDRSEAIIVNEMFVKKFGLPNNGIGERIRWGDKNNPSFETIVGVVKDFNQSSLRTPIEAQMFLYEPALNASVKITQNLPGGIDHIKQSWAQIFPNIPFAYRFLDQEIQREYEVDQIRGKIFSFFSILTIIISFLGLFGLASYLVKRRVKEIGIRKVMGASLLDSVFLITKDFIFLVIIASIPAFIGAWYFIGQWLEEFAFRTNMNYILFALILLTIVILTFFTTGLHALRAAQLNPAQTLKYE